MGFRLVIGFIEHLQTVTTSNYSAMADSHTLQFITARTTSSQSAVFSPGVVWQRFQRRRSLNFRVYGFKSSLAVVYLTADPEFN
jgi:hypothetical protein